MNSPLPPNSTPHGPRPTVLSFGSQQRTGWVPHSPKLYMYRGMCWDLPPQRLGTWSAPLPSSCGLRRPPMEPTPGVMNDLRNRAWGSPNSESFKAVGYLSWVGGRSEEGGNGMSASFKFKLGRSPSLTWLNGLVKTHSVARDRNPIGLKRKGIFWLV